MNTHIGKIGRLPKNIRHFLGVRIEEGIPQKELVKWLNEDEAVQEVLELRFGGRAITEQNLSEWKQTGHREWVRREERRWLALHLTEQRDEEEMEPEESVAEKEISDRLGRELGLEMARLALELVDQEGSTDERWKRLCAVYKEVSKMRQDDHRAERARIQRERWQREQEREEIAATQKEESAAKQQMLDLLQRPGRVAAMAPLYGPGKIGKTLAELAERIKGEELEGVNGWFRQAWSEVLRRDGEQATPAKSEGNGGNPSESDQIQPEKIMADDEQAGSHLGHDKPDGWSEEHSTLNIQLPTSKGNDKEHAGGAVLADGHQALLSEGNDKTEEIGVNPGKSKQEIENEEWLRKMNFI